MKKQYTIRGIGEDLDRAVRETAAASGVSVNKAAVTLLRKGAGLDTGGAPPGPPYHDLNELAGTISPEEADKLLKALDRLRRTDRELWKKP